MTTPTFISGTVGLGQIRYYTQFDPYFFSVDNRPIGDLASNDAIIAGAADAGRRALMIEQIGAATINAVTYGTSRYLIGLALSNPSANVLQVGPGVDFESIAVNASDSRVIVKRGVLPFATTFSIPAPGLGNSVIYLVQGRYVDFGSINPLTSVSYPSWDPANTYLPTTLLNGELQLSIVNGSSALTGNQVAPLPTAGWFPIYQATVVGTGSSFTAVYDPAAPLAPGLSARVNTLTNINGATSTTIADTPVNAFADSTTSGVLFTIHLNAANLNSYKPIKFTLGYSPSVTNNAVAMRVKYQAIGVGDLINPASYTTAALENIPISGAADSYNQYTLVTSVIPATAIQAALVANKTRFTIAIERIGADAGDTNTGSFRLVDLLALQ